MDRQVIGTVLRVLEMKLDAGESVVAESGEMIKVHPGHVGMFEGRVSFELDHVKGIKNMVFGGDGIFLAKLTGPGKVWLQTPPLPTLAASMIPYLPSPPPRRAAPARRGASSPGSSTATADEARRRHARIGRRGRP